MMEEIERLKKDNERLEFANSQLLKVIRDTQGSIIYPPVFVQEADEFTSLEYIRGIEVKLSCFKRLFGRLYWRKKK